jgi:hypothetical protein
LTIDALPRDAPEPDSLMPSYDLTDADRAALIELLRETIATDRCITRPNAAAVARIADNGRA